MFKYRKTFAAICLTFLFSSLHGAEHQNLNTMEAKGYFETDLTPQKDDQPEMGRMLISKTFFGDIEGTSEGQMLSLRTEVKGSAAYVAIERCDVMVHGKSGGFALQHTGIMNRGESSLVVSIVPDSGMGELSGITGEMTIDIKEGKHLYTFTYTLPE